MLIIEMAQMEFTVGHIEIMLFLEITKIKLTGSHIVTILIIDIAKIESTAGHIEIMLFIEITKIK